MLGLDGPSLGLKGSDLGPEGPGLGLKGPGLGLEGPGLGLEGPGLVNIPAKLLTSINRRYFLSAAILVICDRLR